MLTWAYETLTIPGRCTTFDTAGAASDSTEPTGNADEAEQDLGPSHPAPTHSVLDFGTLSAGGSSHALRFDVFFDGNPPNVDYQPRGGRFWTTDALAVDDPNVAVRIEVVVAAPAGSPDGNLCDRIVVTFDNANSVEIEIRGKVVGLQAAGSRPGPLHVASRASTRAPRKANRGAPVRSRSRHASPRHRRQPPVGRRIATCALWAVFGLACVAVAVALSLGSVVSTSELPNILWLQFVASFVCVLFLGLSVFVLLPWSILHAVRLWRPERQRINVRYRRTMSSTLSTGIGRSQIS